MGPLAPASLLLSGLERRRSLYTRHKLQIFTRLLGNCGHKSLPMVEFGGDISCYFQNNLYSGPEIVAKSVKSGPKHLNLGPKCDALHYFSSFKNKSCDANKLSNTNNLHDPQQNKLQNKNNKRKKKNRKLTSKRCKIIKKELNSALKHVN